MMSSAIWRSKRKNPRFLAEEFRVRHAGRIPSCPAPDLKPIENVGQFMRENRLSNRVFQSYGDILDHCGHA